MSSVDDIETTISVGVAQDEPSPPHTPHASFSAVEPQALSQPDGPATPQPQPRSKAEPLHSPAQSGVPTQPSTSSHIPSLSTSSQALETVINKQLFGSVVA